MWWECLHGSSPCAKSCTWCVSLCTLAMSCVCSLNNLYRVHCVSTLGVSKLFKTSPVPVCVCPPRGALSSLWSSSPPSVRPSMCLSDLICMSPSLRGCPCFGGSQMGSDLWKVIRFLKVHPDLTWRGQPPALVHHSWLYVSRLVRWLRLWIWHHLWDPHCGEVWRVVRPWGRDHEPGLHGHHLPLSAALQAWDRVVQRR